MPPTPLTEQIRANLRQLQQNEIDGHYTYLQLATLARGEANQQLLQRMAAEEQKHYEVWYHYTQQSVAPRRLRIGLYSWMARLLGLTFALKLMELGEEQAQAAYKAVAQDFPEALEILEQEERHEDELLAMLDEEALRYAGSVVLGLNDALVEFTGALAGLTFALRDGRLIALAGLISGISASFSMAASEYLSQKSEGGELNPLRAALYTGVAYLFTVAFLVLPYLLLPHYLLSLGLTIINAVLVIAVFNFYISVAKSLSFRQRFTEMTLISLGVATLSFIIGTLIRTVLGVEV